MNRQTLIAADQHWLLWAILISVAFLGLWGERTKVGSKISAVVISILGTFVLSNLSIIPSDAPAYDTVWSFLVPLAIPLLLFKADLKRIIKEAGPTLLAYFFGAIGTIAGTIIAFESLPLGPDGWKFAAIFSSTYIGGSMNYVAAAQAVQLKSGNMLAAGVAADNLVMATYFLVLFAIPSIKFFQRKYANKYNADPAQGAVENASGFNGDNKLDLMNMGKSLSISASICAAGFLLETFLGIKGSAILIITAIIVLIATVFHKQMSQIKGAEIIGTFLMQIFFAAIGASANIGIVLKYGPILFLFAAFILFVHLLFILIAGKFFNLDLAEILIASNANIGGPTTAAAMAVANKWNALVIPSILCGTLGYATATFIGVGLGFWLK